jgi:NAD(P)-dependent dehydrogenase (short-subunit alcohol dehydrogenase family)
VVPLDVTDPDSVAAAARAVADEQRGAGLHAVINNAGVIVSGPLELIPPAELHRQFAVNVYGPALVTSEFLPLLRQGKGRVVNISAPTARVAIAYAGGISASKAALESLSTAARVELAPWRIPVIIVVPGAMATDIFVKSAAMAKVAFDEAPPERVALYRAQLDAVDAALARQRNAPAETAARVVVKATEARRPKLRYTAGADARLAGLLSRLPGRTRDRLITRTLGLHAVPAGR